MARPVRPRSVVIGSTAVAFSAVLHGVVVLLGMGLLRAGWLSLQRTPSRVLPVAAVTRTTHTIDIELPRFHTEAAPTPARSAVPALAPTSMSALPSGADAPRPDTGRDGRGGRDHVSEPGLNLADEDQGIRLVRSVASHIDRDQVPRVLSNSIRRSWENQRLTTNPMELTFLASGSGDRHERREPSERDPSKGWLRSRPATAEGAEAQGTPALPAGVGQPIAKPGGEKVGSDYAAAGIGVSDGASGLDHRASADVAYARPMVDKGDPSVPSPITGRPKDNVDSTQQIAKDSQSLADASTAGGRLGAGPGGQNGPGPTGYGGMTGPGSRSRPLGYGPGGNGWNAKDPRLSLYRRSVLAKIWPFWEHAFPKWASADMRQGRVIIAVTILPDGSLHTAHVTRTSGIDEFDRNCLKAIQRAAPFAPFPRNFPLVVLSWELSFDASNPIVR